MAGKTDNADGQSERLQMRVSREFITAVDDWRRRQPDIPSRSEAIRRLVERGLAGEGGKEGEELATDYIKGDQLTSENDGGASR